MMIAGKLLGIFCGVFLIVLLAVPLFGQIWHLFHGDSFSYAGWKIPVPNGFYVHDSGQDTTMWRLSLGVPLLDKPYGHISLYTRPSPFDFNRDSSRFDEGVTEEAGRTGFQLVSRQAVVVGGRSGYCLEFHRSTPKQPRSLVRCAVTDSVVVVFYEGDARYLSQFFTMLGGMILENSANRAALD